MGKPRACDVCSLRKIRCSGGFPCVPCVKAQFDCSWTRPARKPGPKGPRATTSNRIRKRLQDIRSQATIHLPDDGAGPATSSTATSSLSSPSADGPEGFYIPTSSYLPLPPTSVPSGPSAVTYYDVCAYLKIYSYKMYAIWPVIDATELIAKLGEGMEDAETCALAYSVCAATGAQLKLGDFELVRARSQYSMIDRFAIEAERCRAKLTGREHATLASVLIPFFLHMYYSSAQKRITSTLYLRESLTMCELLDLDKEAIYATLDEEEQKYRRKVFWLLFVTERGNAMQHDMATVLRTSIKLPEANDDKDPALFTGFLNLVRLFVAVEGTLVGGRHSHEGHQFSMESFTRLQEQLQSNPDIPAHANEVQMTDICVTQQWMRMLVWQLAMKKVTMTAGSSDDPLSLTYPAHVAKDSLAFLSRVSLDSIIAHGPGMELKIFEIANTLLDVIHCVPSVTRAGPMLMTQGPRDIFHGLSCLLASLSGGQSKSLALLQGKMAEANVPFQQIPCFIELENDMGASTTSTNPVWTDSSPTDLGHDFAYQSLPVGPTSHPSGPKRQNSDESVSSMWADRASSPLPSHDVWRPATYDSASAATLIDPSLAWANLTEV